MVKIEQFECEANREYNGIGLIMKKDIFTGLKSIEFDTTCYPDMQIEDLKLSDNKEETDFEILRARK